MGPAERYTNTGRGEWTIALVRKASPGGGTTAAAGPPPAPEPTALERELIARGVTRITAAELVRDYPEERIAAQVEALDWLSRGSPKKVGDPAAYLVDAIRKDYAAPKGFETRAARARREEAERQRQAQEADARRRQRQEQARERAEQAKVTKYWNALSTPEQARLEAEALEQAEESLARSYRQMQASNNPVASSFLRLIRDAHITRILNLGRPGVSGAPPASGRCAGRGGAESRPGRPDGLGRRRTGPGSSHISSATGPRRAGPGRRDQLVRTEIFLGLASGLLVSSMKSRPSASRACTCSVSTASGRLMTRSNRP
jgi:hypothetical protein